MEEQIKKTSKCLKNTYRIFCLVCILLLLFSTVEWWQGCLADKPQLIYIVETVLILLTAVCIPLALKLFAWVLVKRIDQLSIDEALKAYKQMSLLRLLLLAIPSWMGFIVYATMLSGTGLLCGLIAVTATLFCLPGEKSLRSELHIDKNSSEEEKLMDK